ncbi:MAG: hypothetical protein IK012_13205 [Fibrobacter sp.]|uniref:patatin-like phospholipase family protein n=1 Tax=Fibrobacter sp. TaxID=35828 RepID=UPI0025B7BB3B|nr:patatin-like phospholipase family protein [Fibrobacter sp.]MBR4786190.1 hypothetical protein [Fibrobacter sp.]
MLQVLSATPDSVVAQDSVQAAPVSEQDSSANPVAADSASVQDTVAVQAPVDSAAAAVTVSKPLKSVLYLGGGENSPWFHLGVLYAIETYSVPVDSIVGTSWGAYVGALWAKGVAPDDIQRILLDSDLDSLAGFGADDASAGNERFAIPVSEKGFPSLRQRFSVHVDSSGALHRRLKKLSPDSSSIESSLAVLRLQESLLRHKEGYRIPFAVLGCDSVVGNSYDNIMSSLPVFDRQDARDHISGDVCPYLSLPAEDSPDELAIIAVASPLRGEYRGTAWKRAIREGVLKNLGTQPGVIVRPHTIADSSRNGWIQAGFSALESKLSHMAPLGKRNVDYASNRVPSVPWFKFKPTYDSLPSETHNPVKSYWNASDTGLVAPRNFAYGFSQFPSCDSVSFNMLSDGDVLVDANIEPTFDIAAGGFGSNVLGPNAYAELSFYFVNQMEIALTLAGFYGGNTFGFTPHLSVERLWSKDWGLSVAFDWMHLRPLKSYINEVPAMARIYEERKSDISLMLHYRINEHVNISADFLFADRTYEVEEKIYYTDSYNVYPASQKLRLEYLSGDGDRWFSRNGLSANMELGLTSVGFDFGFDEFIPTFITVFGDVQYSLSPKPFASLTAAAAFATERFHKEGFGYVYPETSGYRVLDNTIRHRIKPTPWRSEWLDSDLASHEYGLLRLSGGLHYHGNGLWLFSAYVHDFEENPTASLGKHRFVFEPALRLSYKSVCVYAGLSRIVDSETFSDLKKFKDYDFFIRIGNYDLF